jgi:hypothetical protein
LIWPNSSHTDAVESLRLGHFKQDIFGNLLLILSHRPPYPGSPAISCHQKQPYQSREKEEI